MASSELEQKVKRLEGQVMQLEAKEDTDRADIGKLKARMDELTEFAHKTEALRRETPTEAPPDAIS
jgi:predicted nuclease with TOPRIM domain